MDQTFACWIWYTRSRLLTFLYSAPMTPEQSIAMSYCHLPFARNNASGASVQTSAASKKHLNPHRTSLPASLRNEQLSFGISDFGYSGFCATRERTTRVSQSSRAFRTQVSTTPNDNVKGTLVQYNTHRARQVYEYSSNKVLGSSRRTSVCYVRCYRSIDRKYK